MERQHEVLLLTLDRLDALKIPYYVTGSIAVTLYGKPRFTHDIDLVIAIYPAHIPSLVAQFQKDFYISPEGLQDALTHHSMANIIHNNGMKVDLWMLNPENEYSLVQFERRRSAEAFGRKVFFISPEDLILQKLLWHKELSAERDWNDLLGVWEFLSDTLDLSYIQHWAERLSVSHSLEKLLTL
ncbi:MAG TPA: DUF6036 family nucleotidyltransferase [Bacteroidota bacterium]